MRFFITWALVIFASLSHAIAGVELPNNVSANVIGTTSFDNVTGLYTYRYSIANDGQSPKPVHEIHIPLRGASILNIVAPIGWEGSVNKSQKMIGWCACAEDGFVPPPGYVNDGRGILSRFAVMPGSTLAGFSFQSPYPPSPGVFYAGAWVPVPVEGVDFTAGLEPPIPDFPTNLLSGSVVGPLKSDARYVGGRRPAVEDAFGTKKPSLR
jgi:hypothetical protein